YEMGLHSYLSLWSPPVDLKRAYGAGSRRAHSVFRGRRPCRKKSNTSTLYGSRTGSRRPRACFTGRAISHPSRSGWSASGSPEGQAYLTIKGVMRGVTRLEFEYAIPKTTSRRGNDYTRFKLQGPRDCGTVDVF